MSTVDNNAYGRQFVSFYDQIFPRDAVADQIASVLAELHPGDGLPSLELGVGTGRIAIPLAERTGEVVGVDSSPEMLSLLEKAVAHTALPITGVEADICGYADERCYGLVYCVCGTLSMILDAGQQQKVFCRVAELLAPGGAVVVETHNKSGVLAIHAGQRRTSFFVPYPEAGTGLLSYSTIDPIASLWHLSHVWFEGRSSTVAVEVSRLTTPEEVDGYARNAGLLPVRRTSNWTGEPYNEQSSMFVTVYRRN